MAENRRHNLALEEMQRQKLQSDIMSYEVGRVDKYFEIVEKHGQRLTAKEARHFYPSFADMIRKEDFKKTAQYH
jgi:hypothetical protein